MHIDWTEGSSSHKFPNEWTKPSLHLENRGIVLCSLQGRTGVEL